MTPTNMDAVVACVLLQIPPAYFGYGGLAFAFATSFYSSVSTAVQSDPYKGSPCESKLTTKGTQGSWESLAQDSRVTRESRRRRRKAQHIRVWMNASDSLGQGGHAEHVSRAEPRYSSREAYAFVFRRRKYRLCSIPRFLRSKKKSPSSLDKGPHAFGTARREALQTSSVMLGAFGKLCRHARGSMSVTRVASPTELVAEVEEGRRGSGRPFSEGRRRDARYVDHDVRIQEAVAVGASIWRQTARLTNPAEFKGPACVGGRRAIRLFKIADRTSGWPSRHNMDWYGVLHADEALVGRTTSTVHMLARLQAA